MRIARIRIAAPVDIGLGEVGIDLPILFLDQRQNAGTVTARLGAEDAITGATGCLILRQSLADPFAQFGEIMLAHEVLRQRLVQLDDGIDCVIDQIDQLRECIAEKAADARCYIDARAFQFRKRNHFDAGQLSIFRSPHRTHTEQRQNLRHVIAMRAHRAGAPDTDGDAFRIVAGFAHMARQHFMRQLRSDAPGRLRRHAARIDRVEIAPGR